ncbi:hypothetical protein AGMMS49960_08460 [Betaproteobacteria bacterium]|nr:hypothetical protein AGMMS49543_08400 [Betaproteobacteria bacterium]GHU00445.1 hypothetical protein AGMMS49960_08460 [Betaproteobacteria bacterium]GHU18241.1 hypothetical protein AGMMS50243_07930 [Betaproteobacteria bacterium]
MAAMVGLDNRSTLDVDATIKNLSLTVESAREVVEGITAVQIDDGMMFKTKSATIIMDEADYSGVRVMLDTMLETMRTPLKIDFSTGDVITPQEIEHSFRLLVVFFLCSFRLLVPMKQNGENRNGLVHPLFSMGFQKIWHS